MLARLYSLPSDMLIYGIKIWYPVDFYLALSRDKRRMLEVPTIMVHNGVTKAFRFEFTFLLSFVLILDFRSIKL
jgi:hypothetical protein